MAQCAGVVGNSIGVQNQNNGKFNLFCRFLVHSFYLYSLTKSKFILKNNKNIRLFISDIDGVWTDGGMYYDKEDNEWKKFNTSDSAGVLFLKLAKINFAIITDENTPIVQRRANKLKVENCFLGIKDKVAVAKKLLEK